mmetsp:Transcript_64208/g.128940  ORF Transcript_64208/g.128940 Transcript_64208/m.128940 type:complete len:217 (+) Transcript_64208:48-698(+)
MAPPSRTRVHPSGRPLSTRTHVRLQLVLSSVHPIAVEDVRGGLHVAPAVRRRAVEAKHEEQVSQQAVHVAENLVDQEQPGLPQGHARDADLPPLHETQVGATQGYRRLGPFRELLYVRIEVHQPEHLLQLIVGVIVDGVKVVAERAGEQHSPEARSRATCARSEGPRSVCPRPRWRSPRRAARGPGGWRGAGRTCRSPRRRRSPAGRGAPREGSRP